VLFPMLFFRVCDLKAGEERRCGRDCI